MTFVKLFSQAAFVSVGVLLAGHFISESALAYPGDQAPDGSMDALMTEGDSRPEYRKVMIDRDNKIFQIWHPPGIQGAMLHTYKLSCFKPGCIITGPDFGYSIGPDKHILKEFSSKLIEYVFVGNQLNDPLEYTIEIIE